MAELKSGESTRFQIVLPIDDLLAPLEPYYHEGQLLSPIDSANAVSDATGTPAFGFTTANTCKTAGAQKAFYGLWVQALFNPAL